MLPKDKRWDGAPGSADILLFEGFRLDRRGGVLYRLGQAAPIVLGSRTLNLLGLLAARQGEVVSKDEILGVVWPGRVVEESNLNVQIAKVRRILDQNRDEGSVLEGSVRRVGNQVRVIAHSQLAADLQTCSDMLPSPWPPATSCICASLSGIGSAAKAMPFEPAR